MTSSKFIDLEIKFEGDVEECPVYSNYFLLCFLVLCDRSHNEFNGSRCFFSVSFFSL